MRVHITAAVVRNAKFPPHLLPKNSAKFHAIFDDEVRGFHVRVSRAGEKSFWLKYSLANKQRYKRIADGHPGLVEEARKQAAHIKLAAASGRDSVADTKRKARRQTIADLMPGYLDAIRQHRRASTFVELERYLQGTERTPAAWTPLLDRYPEEVERHEVVAVLDGIAANVGRTTADKARSAFSGFWQWAANRSPDIDVGLVARLPSYSGPSRERFLSEAELRAVWRALGEDAFSDVVRLLVLTGCRKTEIGDLRREEVVNGNVQQIELPSERTKNGKPHVVPLPTLAWEIVSRALAETTDTKPFLFGRYGSDGFSGWSKAKADLDKRVGVAPWTLHDLRRTFSTHMHEANLAEPHIIEACLNHISGARASVAGTYNRAAYLVQKRAAFEAWAAWVAALVARKS